MLLLFLGEVMYHFYFTHYRYYSRAIQKSMSQEIKDTINQTIEMLSRGEAIKKIGGYAALTALGTFMILNPQKAQAQSIPDTGTGGGFGPCTDNSIATCCPACEDSDVNTICTECPGVAAGQTVIVSNGQNTNGDCNIENINCTEPAPFQGNTTNKINFDSKYKSRYKSKYSKK